MRRRDFITLLGGVAAAWPLGARAQQPGGLPRVVHVVDQLATNPEAQARSAAFRTAFEKLGWADGRNVRIDYRSGVIGPERWRSTAAEVANSAPSVILVQGSGMSEALRLATRTVPIVFVAVTDPISSGLVDSMAHPGGNLTGFANYEASFGGKWVETLKQAAPDIKRVLVIMEPRNIGQQALLRAIEAAAPVLRLQPVTAIVSTAPEIERAIGRFAMEPNGGMLVLPGLPGRDNSDLIIALAARHRLPAMYTYREFSTSGGLMSYDTDITDLYRRASSYVDRILRGEKPGDLPVQLPTKYDLVVNLKTAKTLGLTVPLPLLASADEVIE